MKKTIYFIVFFIFLNVNPSLGQSAISKAYETTDYKILFPGPYQTSTQTVASKLGQLSLTIVSFEPGKSVKDSNYVYMVMETKYPDSTVHSDKTEILDDFFRNSIDGSIKSVNGKLIKETIGKFGKYPKRTVEIDYQSGLAVIKLEMILRESRMIILQTITSTQTYPNSSINTFMNSLNLN